MTLKLPVQAYPMTCETPSSIFSKYLIVDADENDVCEAWSTETAEAICTALNQKMVVKKKAS